MILFSHIIDGIDLELNNSEENIPRIGFGGVTVSMLKTKYCRGIKGSDIEIYILFSI